jgi:quercetin dioxygenase-like cupin family protein
MKIAVIGGTGLIGSKTVAIPRRGGHEVIAASPQTVSTAAAHGPQPDPRSANGRIRDSMKRILYSLLVATLPVGSVLADAPKSENAKVTLVYQHEPPNVPGKSIKSVLVEYGPGGSSPGHTHPKSAFIYATVLEGEILSQVNDGPVTTYKAGQSFSELPGDHHGVSANASKTQPAKLLAVFVVDTNEKELTTPFGN